MHAFRNLTIKFLFGLSCLSAYQTTYAAPEDISKRQAQTVTSISPAKISSVDNPVSFRDFIKKSTLAGHLRSYYFTRDYSNPMRPHQASFSLGGALNLKTAPIYHVSAALSYYAAESLGLNSGNIIKTDPTLPARSTNILGQAFLQYQNSMWLLRIGNQIIKTPWLNDADTRIIPATYEAVLTTFSPLSGLDISVFRQLRYKSRTAGFFNQSNNYFPENFGGTPIIGIKQEPAPGTLAAGTQYTHLNLETQIWFYRFYDFAELAYTDAKYVFKNATQFHPIIAVQLARENGDGKNVLAALHHGKTHSAVVGGLLGLEIFEGQITLGYDYIPRIIGAFRDGDIVSPYTTGYVADPLYSTSMIQGLVEKAAGQAFKLTGNYFLFDKQLKLAASFAKYYPSSQLHPTNELDFDITYAFNKTFLKGLSLRNRLGILNGNPTQGRYVYNRIMLQYNFNFG